MLKKCRTQKAIKIIIRELFFCFFFLGRMLIFQSLSVLKILFAQVMVFNMPAAMIFLFRIFFIFFYMYVIIIREFTSLFILYLIFHKKKIRARKKTFRKLNIITSINRNRKRLTKKYINIEQCFAN